MFSKMISHIVTGIYVDSDGIKTVKQTLLDKNTRIVFMPMTRSIADMVVIELINFIEDL